MAEMLNVAFKEWAVVCRALATGQQSIILRKGGIAEVGGEFRPEHDRFLLYPTHFHEQQQRGIKTEFWPLLAEAEETRPACGLVRLQHVVTVQSVHFANNLEEVLARSSEHIWSEETVRQRFAYRNPGLYMLTVSVSVLKQPVDIVETPEYAGCKSWVLLNEPISVG
jgi:hypothetical protein